MNSHNKQKNPALNQEDRTLKKKPHQDALSHDDSGSHPVAGSRSQNVESIEDIKEDLDESKDSGNKKK